MGELAKAKPAPVAVRKNSRRVGLMALAPEFRAFVVLAFGVFAPVLFFIFCSSLGCKLVVR
jgi:hypothetical protein